jgi:hypothetical protein
VRLVDDEHAGAGGEPGEHPVAEVGVVQPLRADQQHVDLAGIDSPIGVLPVAGVRRVDGDGVDAGPGGGVDLVAHQRQQRRDDDRGPGALLAQQGRRDEVHRGLPPAGALHHQRPPAVLDQRPHGRPLVLAQPGVRAGQGGQHGFGPVA